jgi:hypothetical protein
VKKIDRESHEVLAGQMGWDDLALSIIEMEHELEELRDLLTKKDYKEREQTLEIYEKEKQTRVENTHVFGPKSYLIYGQDFVSCWNYDEDPYF